MLLFRIFVNAGTSPALQPNVQLSNVKKNISHRQSQLTASCHFISCRSKSREVVSNEINEEKGIVDGYLLFVCYLYGLLLGTVRQSLSVEMK